MKAHVIVVYINAYYNSHVIEDASNKLKNFWKKIGPGFVTGAADDDPSGIATYSQSGALFGYNQLWLVIVAYPLMTVVQEMCGRIGIVTGHGLSGVLKNNYPKTILFGTTIVLVLANVVNIGADLGAMASAMQLLIPVPYTLALFVFSIGVIGLEIYIPYHRYETILKYLTFSLFAYIITAFIIGVHWTEVLTHLVFPHVNLSQTYMLGVVAFLGTCISPYLFYWQTSQEVEDEIVRGEISDFGEGTPKFTVGDMNHMRMDTALGMFFSQMVTFFIIISVAGTIGLSGSVQLETAAEAAEALRPLAGDFAFLLFALGIIGTGLLAVPVLAGSAGYAVSEALGLKTGLEKNYANAHGFYAIIALATLAGLAVNLLEIPPMLMLYYSAVLNGLLAPILLIVILLIANNKTIMGDYVNSRTSNFLGLVTIIAMSGAGIFLIYSSIFG